MRPEESPPAAAAAAATGNSCSTAVVLQGRYELGRVLGRGSSSKVYRARDVRTGVHVAVKAVRKPRRHPCSPAAGDGAAAAARRSVEREIAALRRAQGHPNVVRLLDVMASRSTVYLVLELARGGSLLSAIESRGRCDEPAARRLFAQLASALVHLHSRGVFHRDVKPQNLLLDERGDLKLTDFGLCSIADEHHLGADGLAATFCGSPAYVAPEILLEKRYDAGKADVWSSGVTLFTLTVGHLPFNDGNLMAMYRKICSGKFRFPKWCSPELRCLIGRMLDPRPDTRISIAEILEHPWLQQHAVASTPPSPAGSSQHHDAAATKWETEIEQTTRELNAFDIIACASGCDLSGLIGPVQDRVRFSLPGGAVASVLDRAATLGRREGFTTRRKEEASTCGGVVFEGDDGRPVVRVRVYRLVDQVLMVEAERASADDPPLLWMRLQTELKFDEFEEI